MEREKIEKKVNDVLNGVLGVSYSEIKDDAVLETDLWADSIDVAEIVMDLEQEFGISIPDEKMYGNESCTVKDVYDLVEELI